MTVSLLAAMAENRVIGRDNDLPWHLPDDLRRFKQLTMGHRIIMGRRTFESIGRPLPGRHSVVLSRDPSYRAAGATTAGSLEEALAAVPAGEEAFVIGGAEVFRLALPRTGRIYLTIVHADIEGDVRLPPCQEEDWALVEDRYHSADARHAYPFSFRRYERRVEP